MSVLNRVASELHTLERVRKVATHHSDILPFSLERAVTTGQYVFSSRNDGVCNVQVQRRDDASYIAEIDLLVILGDKERETPIIIETTTAKYSHKRGGTKTILQKNIERKKDLVQLLCNNLRDGRAYDRPQLVYVLPGEQCLKVAIPNSVVAHFVQDGNAVIPFFYSGQWKRIRDSLYELARVA